MSEKKRVVDNNTGLVTFEPVAEAPRPAAPAKPEAKTPEAKDKK